MKARSLQASLQRNLLLSLLVVMLVLLILIDKGVEAVLNDYILSSLQEDAESIVSVLERSDNTWIINPKKLPLIYQRVNSGHYYVLLSDHKMLKSRSLWDHPVVIPMLTAGKKTTIIMSGVAQQSWLTWSQGINLHGIKITVWVAEDIAPVEQKLFKYRLIVVTLALMGLICLLYLQRRIVKREFSLLKPITLMIKEMRLNEFSKDDIPVEIQPLVAEITRLLLQLEQRVARSRNAMGDLAHALKHPLQRLRLITEQLPIKYKTKQQEVIAELEHKISRELKHARIVGVSTPGRQTILAEAIPPLVQVLQQIYPDCIINCDYVGVVSIPQDHDDMQELLGYLLDNACRYAGGIIDFSVTVNNNNCNIVVADHGAGIDEQSIQQILQRGTRLDESVAGTGLGLAICADIVDFYHGTLQLLSNKPSGLVVKISLPIND